MITLQRITGKITRTGVACFLPDNLLHPCYFCTPACLVRGNMYNKASILIVDDELAICKAISHELKRHGYLVSEMSSGADAVAALKDTHFDVVITDLVMDEIDGFGVIEAAKEWSPLACVMVMTGYGRNQDFFKSVDLGVEDILIKPFDIDELVSKIEGCFKRSLLKQVVEMKEKPDSIDENLRDSENRSYFGDMAVDEKFLEQVIYLDLNLINESQDVIYIVDANFILKAYNKAWVTFAKSNSGDDVLARYPLGSRILDAITEPLKRYFSKAFESALREKKPFEHNYKCPSEREDRIFRQSAYPLKDATGLVISNHLVLEKPFDEDPREFSKKFLNDKGLIRQCSCCRRISDPNEHAWLWVPSLVENPVPETSHGICPQCLNHFYPDIE